MFDQNVVAGIQKKDFNLVKRIHLLFYNSEFDLIMSV